MTTELTTHQTQSLGPRPAEPDLRLLLLSLTNLLSADDTLERALTRDERAAVTARGHELGTALTVKPDLNAHREAIAAMLLGFTLGRGISEREAKIATTQFVKVVKGLPSWAVRRGCELIEHGQAGLDPNFLPNTAQFRAAVVEVLRPFREEHYRLGKLARAKVVPPVNPEMKRRMGELLGELASTMKAEIEERERDEREQRAKRLTSPEKLILDDYARRGQEPPMAGNVPLSASLIETVRRKERERIEARSTRDPYRDEGR